MQSSRFHFFISGEEKEVFPDSRLYKLPLSGKISSEHKTRDLGFTIGDYFSAARQFLLKDDFAILT